MGKVKTIVVPVDFSENTDKLLDYAVYMAKELSATPHFFHALSIYTGYSMSGVPLPVEYEASCKTNAEEKMDDLVSKAQAACPDCKGDVRLGEPVLEIVRFAEALQADLIIISTHGAKGLESILLGSVARRVVKRAHCPVLVMNPYKKTT